MDKKKLLVYGLGMALPVVCLFFVLFFAVNPGIDYVVAYEILALEVCFLIVGVIWHTAMKDWTVKVIASKVWFAGLIGVTISIILSQTWEELELYAPLAVLTYVNWLGFRYVVGDDSTFFTAIVEDKVETLAHKMLYKIDEHGKEIVSEPLCVVEGTPVTPARAMEKGYTDVAEKGYEYIRSII